MAREFTLPDVGEGLTEAEIVSWLVAPGDTVSEDQPVAEVETDKAVVEVPSPVDGTVGEILAEEGEMVPVGTVIVTFDVDGASADADADRAEASTKTSDAGDAAPDAADSGSGGGRTFASPTTRQLARELGVEIGAVDGSGPGGRITDADVRAAADDAAGVEADADSATGEADGAKSATRRIDDEESFGNRADEDASATASPTEGASTTRPATAADRTRTLAAPATRKHAEEAGVDIDAVPTDRVKEGEAFVTPAEVDAYAEAQTRAQAADAEALSADSAGGAASGDAAEPSPATADRPTPGEDERIPYRGVRRTIGEQMERSKYTAPHATHHDEADVTELVGIRNRLTERAAERGSSLSYLPFVIKAVVAGLKQYPILNSHLDEDNEEIVLRGAHNIGIATATDAGLMVPVLKHADDKSLLEIADEMNDLVERARDRSIAPEEMRGGSFSITNFGAVGGEYATPIINYPETAILGLGAIKEKPRVVEATNGDTDGVSGDAARKEVVPRKVLTISLSIDHRVVDGAEAARFTNTVIEYLESPELLLLE